MYYENHSSVVMMSKMLGKYEILRTLGQGAMGEVYLAHHPAIGREVAIKTILPSAAKGEDAEGRFRREAEAAGKLNHPNLVTIFDFDKDEEILFLVMEFVKGDDLEDLIRQDSLSHTEFLEVLAQVCDGLSHAHRNGIIHRDIKPSNVRVMRDGKHLLAKVMDFGIARMEDSNMTATGIVMGTVSYMAPEYIREGHATSQSDLFAVGVMLYECLTGTKPFAGDNTTTILFKIVSNDPPPIDASQIRGISPNVQQVLARALAKEPAARFQTADDLARALRACKDPTWSGRIEETMAMVAQRQIKEADATQALKASASASASASAPTQQPSAPPAQAKPSRLGLYAAAGVALLALAGGGAYFATRAPKTAPALPGDLPAAASGAPAGNAPQAAPQVSPVLTTPQPKDTPKADLTKPAPAQPAQAKPEPAKAAPAQVAPPQPEPPKPEPPRDPAKQAAALIGTDPKQAAGQLKALLQAAPGSVELNANYLAALYRANLPWDFGRGLSRAAAAGVTTKTMLAIPAFRSAIVDERNLVKARNGHGLLPPDVWEKVLADL